MAISSLESGAAGETTLRQTSRRIPVRGLLMSAWLPSALFVLGLVVRLIVWWQHRGYTPFGDEDFYYRGAIAFAGSGVYSDPPTPDWLPIQRVPLFTLIVGLIFSVAGARLDPVNLVQIAFSLGTCWFVWRWAARLWGETAGRWALAIAVFFPTFITHPAAFLYSDSIFTFFATLCLYLLSLLVLPTGRNGQVVGAATGWLPELDRRALGLALLAGVVAGVAALTRSSGIALVGVAGLWLALIAWRHPARVIAVGAVFVVSFSLTLAPWVYRNYQEYGGFLLLDTIGAYNLWRDNNFNQEKVAPELARIENPIEQQRVATERGLRALREHPDRFLAKIPAATLNLWHLELDSYAQGGGMLMNLTNRTDSLGWVLAADLAHLAVSGLALLAIALRAGTGDPATGRPQLHLLLLLWIGINLVTGVIYHAEARYRIPFQPQLIVFASLALVAWPALLARARAVPWRAVVAAGLLVMLVAGAWSPRLLPVLGMQGWVALGAALEPWQPSAALAAYERGVAVFPTSDRPLVILGDARLAAGDMEGASAAYQAALAIEPHNLNASLPLAFIHMMAGRRDEARRVLEASQTSDTDLIRWTWRHPIAPPVSVVDVGNGLDIGYVNNVHPAERNEVADYRWTNGNGLFRLTIPEAGVSRLVVRLNATRLSQPPAERVSVAIDGAVIETFAGAGDWQEHTIDVAGRQLDPGETVLIEVRSDTFIPASAAPGNRDARLLGVAVDRIAFEPAS